MFFKMNKIVVMVVGLLLMTGVVRAQSNAAIEAPKKANARTTIEAPPAEPCDGA